MKRLSLSNLNKKLGLILLVLFFNQRLALASEGLKGDQVVDRFLEVLKQEVLKDLKYKADNALVILDCIEDKSCSSAQSIFDKYSEYRMYTGLAEFEDLEYRLKQAGHGYAVNQGIKVYFNLRNSSGQKEWSKIQELVSRDNNEKHRIALSTFEGSNSKEQYLIEHQLNRGSKLFYSALLSEYIENYPFFGFIQNQEPDRGEMASAIVRVGEELEKAMVSVSKLEGEERMELMGFSTSVERAVESFSESENKVFTNYLSSKNNETRIVGKLIKIVTNVKTIALATCHIGTYTLAGSPHPIVQIARLSAGFVCSSIGITLTVKYLGIATIDIIRQFQYTKTMQYSSEIWLQNLRSYMITTVMAYLYIIPSLPRLTGRLKDIRTQSQLASRAIRMNKLSFSSKGILKFNTKSFLDDVKGLGNTYAVYYGEELAIHSIVAMGGRHLSSLLKIETALVGGVMHMMEQNPRIFSYSELLKAI